MRMLFAIAAFLSLYSCGRPPAQEDIVRPEQVLDFKTLYKENCSGCHGVDGKGGASIALRDPIFLAIADAAAIRKVAAQGVRGTQLTPFAQSTGGMLTDAQIDVLVRGIRAWSTNVLPGMPPYSAPLGDAQRGADVHATFCTSCHGSKIADPTYLSLVSDQYLRTVIITGRPELGAPDWRSNVAGRPMTGDEISDVVAWLASQRSISK